MLLTRRKPDHVAGPDLLDGATPAPGETAASRHDQGLAQRVGVPSRPSTGLERNTGTDYACRSVWLKQRVNAHHAGKPIGRSFVGRLRATSFDVHISELL